MSEIGVGERNSTCLSVVCLRYGLLEVVGKQKWLEGSRVVTRSCVGAISVRWCIRLVVLRAVEYSVYDVGVVEVGGVWYSCLVDAGLVSSRVVPSRLNVMALRIPCHLMGVLLMVALQS